MNDERPIEKLLRRYAKKRRDGAGDPLELHPATRRLLQGEVSRQFRKAAGHGNNSFAQWFVGLRQRWVYAAAAISVVLIAGVVLVTQKQDLQLDAKLHKADLAKNEISPTSASDKDVAAQERETDVARRFAAPSPTVAPISELSANQPAPATPAPRANDALESGKASSLAINADAERMRVLKDQSTAPFPSSLPSSAEEVAPAQKTTPQKAPLAIAASEEYASTARADKLSSQRLAVKPATAAPTRAAAGASQPAEPASTRAGTAGFNTASIAAQDSKLATTPTATPGAAAGATVAYESRASLAPTARDGGIAHDPAPGVSQSFANRAPLARTEKTAEATPASPVLANFKVEQTGDRLRVIDGDGSTYLGEMTAAPVTFDGYSQSQLRFKKEVKLAEPQGAATPATTQQSAQDYFYRVAGTNRTLNQPVVFTWNLTALTNPEAQSKTKALGGVLNQSNLGAPQQIQMLLQNSAIKGRAQINATKEIEINAVPVKP